jgi:hypothetical protein
MEPSAPYVPAQGSCAIFRCSATEDRLSGVCSEMRKLASLLAVLAVAESMITPATAGRADWDRLPPLGGQAGNHNPA